LPGCADRHESAANPAGPDRDIKLFSDHRKRLVEHRTGLQAKLRWFLHELVPDLNVPSRGMRRFVVLEQITAAITGIDGAVAEIARDLLTDIADLTRRINAIERQLTTIVRVEYPALLSVPGMGVLGAAMIVGETAGITRFISKDAFARFNGTAPMPVWSGNNVRVRLSRGGNRRINTALHMAAVTQQRLDGNGAAYLAKQLTAGKTRVEAMRLLRRRLSDRVFAALRQDDAARTANEPTSRPITLTTTRHSDLLVAA
jgi:transposase